MSYVPQTPKELLAWYGTTVANKVFQNVLTLLPTGFLTNDYSRGGGSLGPRSYFQLILTSFWTHGTIIDQFIVKGVHQ